MRIMLVQTEIERVKLIVRSYVCTRLFKVCFFRINSTIVIEQNPIPPLDREIRTICYDQRRNSNTTDSY